MNFIRFRKEYERFQALSTALHVLYSDFKCKSSKRPIISFERIIDRVSFQSGIRSYLHLIFHQSVFFYLPVQVKVHHSRFEILEEYLDHLKGE